MSAYVTVTKAVSVFVSKRRRMSAEMREVGTRISYRIIAMIAPKARGNLALRALRGRLPKRTLRNFGESFWVRTKKFFCLPFSKNFFRF